jgi:hypothetical protein
MPEFKNWLRSGSLLVNFTHKNKRRTVPTGVGDNQSNRVQTALDDSIVEGPLSRNNRRKFGNSPGLGEISPTREESDCGSNPRRCLQTNSNWMVRTKVGLSEVSRINTRLWIQLCLG